MDIKYSISPFDGYTHIYFVRFQVAGHQYVSVPIHIYSNSDNHIKFIDYIHENKSDKITDFQYIGKRDKGEGDTYLAPITEMFDGKNTKNNKTTLLKPRDFFIFNNWRELEEAGWNNGYFSTSNFKPSDVEIIEKQFENDVDYSGEKKYWTVEYYDDGISTSIIIKRYEI